MNYLSDNGSSVLHHAIGESPVNGGNVMSLAYFQATLAVVRTVGIIVYKSMLAPLKLGPALAAGGLLVFAAAEAATGYFHSYFVMLPAFAVGVFCLSWYFPLRQSAFHQAIEERSRATAVSLDSMITNLFSCAVCIWLARIESPALNGIWGLASIVLAASAAAYYCSQTLRPAEISENAH